MNVILSILLLIIMTIVSITLCVLAEHKAEIWNGGDDMACGKKKKGGKKR